jgi:hypothetical protein
MGEPSPKRWNLWGWVLALALLHGVLLPVLRFPVTSREPTTWRMVAAAVATALAAFVSGRWLMSYFWGLVLALGVTLQPVFLEQTYRGERAVVNEALQMATLALTIAAWRCTFRQAPAWRGWTGVALGLFLLLSGAWLVGVNTGLRCSEKAFLGLLVAFLVGLYAQRAGWTATSRWNLSLALLVTLTVPAGSFLAAGAVPQAGRWLQEQGISWGGLALSSSAADLTTERLSVEIRGPWTDGALPRDLDSWTWPTPWVVLPLAGWGLLRSWWRGRGAITQGRSAVSWQLLVFAVVELTTCWQIREESTKVLSLATLAVVLAVFGIGDYGRAIAERMVLAPPGELEGDAAA